MWFNWVKVGMYALLLLLLLFNCGCCCCCFYMFVHVRANDWVKLKVRLLSAPGAQNVSMCTMCAHVCVWIAQKSGSHKQNQCCSHTHTLTYVAGTLTHTNVNSRRLTAFGGVHTAPWLMALLSRSQWSQCAKVRQLLFWLASLLLLLLDLFSFRFFAFC